MAFELVVTDMPDAVLGEAFSYTPVGIRSVSPVAWVISVGSLPAGLVINPTTGEISGTPTSLGTVTYTIQATDSDAPPTVATASVTQEVVPSAFFRTTRYLTDRKIFNDHEVVGETTAARRLMERHFHSPPSDISYVHDALDLLIQNFPTVATPERDLDDALRYLSGLVGTINDKVFAETSARVVSSYTDGSGAPGGAAGDAYFTLTNSPELFIGSSSGTPADARAKFRLSDPTNEDEFVDDDGDELTIVRIDDNGGAEIDPSVHADANGFATVGVTGPLRVYVRFPVTNALTYLNTGPKNIAVNCGQKKTFSTLAVDSLFSKANVMGEVDADIKSDVAAIKGTTYAAAVPVDLDTTRTFLRDVPGSWTFSAGGLIANNSAVANTATVLTVGYQYVILLVASNSASVLVSTDVDAIGDFTIVSTALDTAYVEPTQANTSGNLSSDPQAFVSRGVNFHTAGTLGGDIFSLSANNDSGGVAQLILRANGTIAVGHNDNGGTDAGNGAYVVLVREIPA